MASEAIEKQSAYVSAGSPKACFLPTCRTEFEGACVHGADGHFYCSFACAEEARGSAFRHVPNIADLRHLQVFRQTLAQITAA